MVRVSGVAPAAAAYTTVAVALKLPPAMVQLLAMAVAFRLVRAPLLSTRPAVPLPPSTRLRLLAEDPVPNTSLAAPVTVRVSGASPAAAAYVTVAVALKLPPAMVQLLAVAAAFRLVSFPLLITRPAVPLPPSDRLRLLAELPEPNTSLAAPVTVSVSGVVPAAAA